ncbi:hypothetical protein ElyMa_002629100 [Elysia marginata]|uniref:Uncharacterized protein n=1 Tax=Elysia marginata TaxID=1093978 RepID=A0AAV4H5N9_9GAST|nr:hypothetical protein ElyMa_002629100 [Elysia marginata]
MNARPSPPPTPQPNSLKTKSVGIVLICVMYDGHSPGLSSRRSVPPRSLRFRRHSSPLAPIWTIAESCLEEDISSPHLLHPESCLGEDVLTSQLRSPTNSETGTTGHNSAMAEENTGNSVGSGCEVNGNTERDSMVEEKFHFQKPGGSSSSIWCEAIFSKDFRLKRVFEKFPGDANEEVEPLMQPYLSPDFNHSDTCMTPPENQGLLVTPQTPPVPVDAYKQTTASCRLVQHSDADTSRIDNGVKFAVDELVDITEFGWRPAKPAALSGRETDSFPFASLDQGNLLNSEAVRSATIQLQPSAADSVLPQKNSTIALADHDRQPNMEVDYSQPLVPGLLKDENFTANTRHQSLETSWNQESHQRPAIPQLPSCTMRDFFPPFPSVSPQSLAHTKELRRKLQRSASAPNWSCEGRPLQRHLTASPSKQHVTVGKVTLAVSDSPPSSKPSVPTPTNGPSSKPNCVRKIHWEDNIPENAK